MRRERASAIDSTSPQASAPAIARRPWVVVVKREERCMAGLVGAWEPVPAYALQMTF